MLINDTKETVPALKVAISYSDEESFFAINKIINLFKFLKLNVVFIPIKIAGDNYAKFINCGIEEQELTNLLKADILINTPFDYSYFNVERQIDAKEYLDYAMENIFQLDYSYNYDNKCNKKLVETQYLKNIKRYIKNLDEMVEAVKKRVIVSANQVEINYEHNDINNDCTINSQHSYQNCRFSISFGAKYAMFSINNLSDDNILFFVNEFLKFFQIFNKQFDLTKFSNVSDAIKFLKSSSINHILFVKQNYSLIIPKMLFDDEKIKKGVLPAKLNSPREKFKGVYQLSEIVESIKEKQIKILDGYELHQIAFIMNDKEIEVYPNINFWDKAVIDPIIYLRENL